jgi:2-phosphoglycerate kinase
MQRTRLPLLVLGTSHVGKSTCANALAGMLDCPVVSTDSLGRHPGRPWTGVPDPVLEFYSGLSIDAVHWFLRVHHQNMRPVIQAVIAEIRPGEGFILEGAAIRPEYLEGWGITPGSAVCLHARADVLRSRILKSSDYPSQSPAVKAATDAFIQRSLLENSALLDAAKQKGVHLVDTTDAEPASVAKQVAAYLL